MLEEMYNKGFDSRLGALIWETDMAASSNRVGCTSPFICSILINGSPDAVSMNDRQKWDMTNKCLGSNRQSSRSSRIVTGQVDD